MAREVGNADKELSAYYKAVIQQGDLAVVGVIMEGSTKNITAQWDAPFEGDTVGSKMEKAAGIIQTGTGATTVTDLSSQQVWTGNLPPTIQLTLLFYALQDAKKEVEAAIMALEQMISPEVNGIIPISTGSSLSEMAGRRPSPLSINLGRRNMYLNCILEDMTTPIYGVKTEDGYLHTAEVDLTIKGINMMNRSEVAGTYL